MDGLTLIEWRVLGAGVVLMAIGFVLSHYSRVRVASIGASLVMAGAGMAVGAALVGHL